MKLKLFFLLGISLLLNACEKQSPTPSENIISFKIDGKNRILEKISVEPTRFYDLTYPDSKQYKVSGSFSPIDSQADNEVAVFYFVEKEGNFILHAFGLNSMKELGGYYGFDLTDSDFKEKVTVSTKRTGNMVVCNFSAKFTFQNKPTKLLTDGICEFDLEGIQ